jgi:hypothetical protein
MLCDKALEPLVSGALLGRQDTLDGVIFEAIEALFLERPLLGEPKLVDRIPAIDFPLDLREPPPEVEAVTVQQFGVPSRR